MTASRSASLSVPAVSHDAGVVATAADTAGPASAAARVRALRQVLEARHRDAVPRTVDGPPLASGWPDVDALLDGGLRPGASVSVDAAPGAGGLALASAWTASAAIARDAALVVDGAGDGSPLAFAAGAPWVVTPPEGALWSSVDLALRGGGFGLVVVLLPPGPGRAPARVGPRLAGLLREHGTRFVALHAGAARALPFTPTHALALRLRAVRWLASPLGAVPLGRSLEVRRPGGDALPFDRLEPPREPRRDPRTDPRLDEERLHPDLRSDRLRARPRAPDRRTSRRRRSW
ncbi:MAG: hypothetical protein AAGH15_25610 [Myxococcota bacterium]